MRDATGEQILYVGRSAHAALERAKALLGSYRSSPASIVSGELDAPKEGVGIGADRVVFRIASRAAPGHALARAFRVVARRSGRRAVAAAFDIPRAEASRVVP